MPHLFGGGAARYEGLVWSFLTRIDIDIANLWAGTECGHCKSGRLHRSDYPRAAHGLSRDIDCWTCVVSASLVRSAGIGRCRIRCGFSGVASASRQSFWWRTCCWSAARPAWRKLGNLLASEPADAEALASVVARELSRDSMLAAAPIEAGAGSGAGAVIGAAQPLPRAQPGVSDRADAVEFPASGLIFHGISNFGITSRRERALNR